MHAVREGYASTRYTPSSNSVATNARNEGVSFPTACGLRGTTIGEGLSSCAAGARLISLLETPPTAPQR